MNKACVRMTSMTTNFIYKVSTKGVIHILTLQGTIEHPTKLSFYSNWFPRIPKFYTFDSQ